MELELNRTPSKRTKPRRRTTSSALPSNLRQSPGATRGSRGAFRGARAMSDAKLLRSSHVAHARPGVGAPGEPGPCVGRDRAQPTRPWPEPGWGEDPECPALPSRREPSGETQSALCLSADSPLGPHQLVSVPSHPGAPAAPPHKGDLAARGGGDGSAIRTGHRNAPPKPAGRQRDPGGPPAPRAPRLSPRVSGRGVRAAPLAGSREPARPPHRRRGCPSWRGGREGQGVLPAPFPPPQPPARARAPRSQDRESSGSGGHRAPAGQRRGGPGVAAAATLARTPGARPAELHSSTARVTFVPRANPHRSRAPPPRAATAAAAAAAAAAGAPLPCVSHWVSDATGPSAKRGSPIAIAFIWPPLSNQAPPRLAGCETGARPIPGPAGLGGDERAPTPSRRARGRRVRASWRRGPRRGTRLTVWKLGRRPPSLCSFR